MTPNNLEQTLAWIAQPKSNYINGAWSQASGRETFTLRNPATLETLGTTPIANQQDVDHAVQAAQTCFRKRVWVEANMREKARIMRQIGQLVRDHHEELALLESLPNGKTYHEAYHDDIPDCADVFDYYSGWIDKVYGETCPVEPGFLNYTLKEPLGVCALIAPWNFPLLMAMWKLAPALAMGNSVVLKPSEYTPLSLIRLMEIIDQEMDLPPGLINVVLGDGTTGGLLTGHAQVHKVSFTGSTAVGRHIIENSARSNLKSVSLELGGKSPNIIFADVPDLETAVERSFQLIFSQKGEKCSEPTRFLLHESIHDAFVEQMVAKAKKYRIGDPLDPNTDQGAQCNEKQFQKILHYIDLGVQEGATLAYGGKRAVVTGFEQGYFVEPTIFTDVTPNMKIFQEEIFGPVLAISKFSSDQEAIDLANDSNYGLAAGLWTSDVSRAHQVAAKLEAGMIFINRYGCYEFSSPFGGFKQSGWGKEMGIHSLESYTKTKSIWLKL